MVQSTNSYPCSDLFILLQNFDISKYTGFGTLNFLLDVSSFCFYILKLKAPQFLNDFHLKVDLEKILDVSGHGDVPELVRVLQVPHVVVALSPRRLLGVQQELNGLEGLVISTKLGHFDCDLTNFISNNDEILKTEWQHAVIAVFNDNCLMTMGFPSP